ncbi:MAG: cell division protein FtsA [Alphaproteobacteria bacterium]|nr:cell division protein FtsA [Alphaproteobacteria bacterium]
MLAISEAMTTRLRPVQPGRSSLVSVLDLGASKICCVVARLSPCAEGKALKKRTHTAEVLGFGYGPSAGIKGGAVIDQGAAEKAVRAAVGIAERMAGVTVQSIIVNVSAGRLSSEMFNATVALGGHAVEGGDLARVLRTVNKRSVRDERSALHALPVGYSLEGQGGIQDPRGMVGQSLGVDVAVITAETLAMRNIELVLNRCHLQVEGFIATPYACGLSALADDEAELGVACVDFGASTTSVGVFKGGHLMFVDAVAVGGHNITLDIARNLSISIEEAERLKTMHASVLPSQSDERDLIAISPISGGKDEATQVPRAVLTRIIRPRVEEILTIIGDRLQAMRMADISGRRFVLTGGGSELTGLPEMARRILGRNVRCGRPLGVSGLPAMAKGPAFCAVAGMLIYPQVCEHELAGERPRAVMTGTDGYFSRIGQWLRSGF